MEEKLRLIVEYIHEKKGIWITPIAPHPHDARQTMLMNCMSSIAKEYFENKNRTTS